MTVTPSLLIKAALEVVAAIFVFFFIGAVFGTNPQEATENTKQLLGVAAFGFAVAGIIFP